MLNLVNIGETIKRLRSEKGITQEQLADKLYVSRQAVSRWEMGFALPSIDNVCELTKIFGTTFETILCLDQQLRLNPDNLFENNSRQYVVDRFVNGEAGIDLSQVLYQFSTSERILLLSRLKEQIELDPNHSYVKDTNLNDLWVKLTDIEKQFFNIDYYKKEIRSK